MISDENLAQIRALMVEVVTELLEAHGLKRVPTAVALRMRAYRVRVTKRNAQITKRNAVPSEKRNESVTAMNGVAKAYIPLADKSEFSVSAEFLAELEAAYPAVDAISTLREIRAWCISNPGNCKTRQRAPRFINSWFAREQNNG